MLEFADALSVERGGPAVLPELVMNKYVGNDLTFLRQCIPLFPLALQNLTKSGGQGELTRIPVYRL